MPPDHYGAMLRAAHGDAELVSLEHAGFGVSHDALGAALCESWGLGAAAVASVRHHVVAQAHTNCRRNRHGAPSARCRCMAHALFTAPQTLDEVVLAVAPGAIWT